VSSATPVSADEKVVARVRRDRPDRMCDVVMKGGITSGVVYPYAVSELADTYRLKNVGGTSAGAIAAAVAAAAEYGREQGGYEELLALAGWLGAPGNLSGLFQPQKATRGLYALLLTSVAHKGRTRPLWILASSLRRFPITALGGAAPGIALLVLGVLEGSGALTWAAVAGGVLLAAAGMLTALAVRLLRQAKKTIPRNMFGMCTGMPGHNASRPALTPWLTGIIDAAARRPEGAGPLTFGDLWAGPDGDSAAATPDEAWLRLEMVTTNVTNHRAERLPSASREYSFDPDEFMALFPADVVQWMLDHPPPLARQASERRDQELRRQLALPLRPMPHAADLPVVVSTRMSLSFPVLLSAVPLWRVDFSRRANIEARAEWKSWLQDHPDDWREILAEPERSPDVPSKTLQAERCWFSDGGIASNFPVHFFDAYLPRHPTFAINLRPFHPDLAPPDDERPSPDQEQHVWMPTKHPEGILDWWYRFEGKLDGFLGNVVRTMQNRSDDAQMRVPGYRDRVVHVSLSKREGGMNLDMDEQVIADLTERGRWAGRRLVERFAQPPPEPDALSWDDHRWVRLRTALAGVSAMLSQIARAQDEPPLAGDRTYDQLLTRDPDGHPTSYKMTGEQRQLARRLSKRIGEIADELAPPQPSLGTSAPRPPPALRVVPQDPPLRGREEEEEADPD
jgi:predicted acylesterase/phospholipase RssA